MHGTEAITVMQVLSPPSPGKPISNPYTRLLVESMDEARVHTVYFRWAGFLTDRFDVLHVHWPEVFVRHPKRIIHLAKCVFLLLFLARIKVQRKAIVRTVHNLTPHEEGSRFERLVLGVLERMTTVRIVLNEATPVPDGSRTVLVPHGHYRDWYTEPEVDEVVPGRLLAFGLLRAYKGIDDLVESFTRIEDEQLSLEICGRPDGDQTAAFLRARAEADPRISLDLRFVPDEDLARAIARAEAVVLPYREVHNSGVALLALSLNRPVIMRRSDASTLLQSEFGAEWITLFEGELSASSLLSALSLLRSQTRGARVDMAARDWALLARKTTDAYVQAFGVLRPFRQ